MPKLLDDKTNSQMFKFILDKTKDDSLSGIVTFTNGDEEDMDQYDFSTSTFVVFRDSRDGPCRVYPTSSIVRVDIVRREQG